jgi:hypothetical protein
MVSSAPQERNGVSAGFGRGSGVIDPRQRLGTTLVNDYLREIVGFARGERCAPPFRALSARLIQNAA